MPQRLALIVAILLALGTTASLHELAQSSATLTIRDAAAVEIRLFVPYEVVLQRHTMARAPSQAFLVTFAAGPDTRLTPALASLHQAIAGGTRILADGRPLAVESWHWPDTVRVQEVLRRALMAATAGGHEHPERLVITASAHARGTITQVQLSLPAVLGPSLLTVVRPEEQWLQPGTVSLPIRVR